MEKEITRNMWVGRKRERVSTAAQPEEQYSSKATVTSSASAVEPPVTESHDSITGPLVDAGISLDDLVPRTWPRG
jgi:hypothetical protein